MFSFNFWVYFTSGGILHLPPVHQLSQGPHIRCIAEQIPPYSRRSIELCYSVDEAELCLCAILKRARPITRALVYFRRYSNQLHLLRPFRAPAWQGADILLRH